MNTPENCSYSIRLINKLKEVDTQNKLDFTLVNKAIYWARKYHGDQKRKSGESYYSHPLEVAYMISDYNLKTDVIVASILHDIVEDTDVTVEMIERTFGQRIAEMVDRLTRDRPDGTKLSVAQVLINAYQKQDEEVLLIKLFDRLHNIQTMDSLSDAKKIQNAEEVIRSFLPIITVFNNIDLELSLAFLSINFLSAKKDKFLHALEKKDLVSFLDKKSGLCHIPLQ